MNHFKFYLLLVFICFLGLFFSTPIFGQGFLNGYSIAPNAAISGYNNKHLTDVRPEDCARACDNETSFDCKSFDYYKTSNACDLSSMNASDVGGLKTNYGGNPYDHYSKTDFPANSNTFENPSDKLFFSRWNKDACGYTKWSQFKLKQSIVIGKLFVWYHWRNNENNVPFTIFNRGNQEVAQGVFKRGDCDPYQTQWCNAETILNIQLPAGEYMVQVDSPRICQNIKSNKKGYIQIKSSSSNTDVPLAPASETSEWNSNFNRMFFVQKGNTVSGRYDYAGGKITGVFEDRTLNGWWSEDDDTKECGPNDNWSGPFVLKFSDDGKSFTGSYGKCASGQKTLESINPLDGTWTGNIAKGSIHFNALQPVETKIKEPGIREDLNVDDLIRELKEIIINTDSDPIFDDEEIE